MKKQIEPIILIVALLLLGIGAALLAYFFPTVKDITGITPLSAQGKNVVPLNAADVTASLASWSSPVIWNEPDSHNRLFSSDKYLFFPSAYQQNPNGNNFIVKIDHDSHGPNGVLLRWYDEHGLDFTDPNVDIEDPDNDGFSNITEYKNEPVGVRYEAKDVDPSKSTDPNDPKSHPPYLNRLRLQKYEAQPFHILFFGYQQLNGKMLFQLHLDDVDPDKQPPLKASGDELGFGGFVIGPFNQAHKMIRDTTTGIDVDTDVSTLELDQPETGIKVILPFRTKINSPEVTADFVMLMPTERDKVIRISVGKTFSVPFVTNTTFLVVSADDKGAVIRGTDGKTYSILTLLDKEWNEVPQAPQAPADTGH
jgi:hypothetical protein